MWQFWATFIVGLWLLLGSGLMGISVNKENFEILYLLTGIFSFTLGLWVFVSPIKGLLKIFSAIIGIAGIWLGICAYISGLQGIANPIIVGIILIVLGFWGALTKPTS
ncbi:hypothetical protein [Candidatus Chrysopegis kryptomonas]|jgi:membrane-bound ClpP family serine protease|uniref:Uncharacterized protein n=1 Tax=Candidatus Chryseopegocella kryptomonas TaxID=1633643 RepID=A0A0P1MY69_9BACT|nr:hypothetical protein [Candidatus Chrysopegis kryptomonas]CUT01040.1 hypothetical protein JGI23_00970 [Candidatus Chrysopegis kryptomonas]